MGRNEPGIRDGTGPYKYSHRAIVEGKTIGRRREAGESCPVEKHKKICIAKLSGESVQENFVFLEDKYLFGTCDVVEDKVKSLKALFPSNKYEVYEVVLKKVF